MTDTLLHNLRMSISAQAGPLVGSWLGSRKKHILLPSPSRENPKPHCRELADRRSVLDWQLGNVLGSSRVHAEQEECTQSASNSLQLSDFYLIGIYYVHSTQKLSRLQVSYPSTATDSAHFPGMQSETREHV